MRWQGSVGMPTLFRGSQEMGNNLSLGAVKRALRLPGFCNLDSDGHQVATALPSAPFSIHMSDGIKYSVFDHSKCSLHIRPFAAFLQVNLKLLNQNESSRNACLSLPPVHKIDHLPICKPSPTSETSPPPMKGLQKYDAYNVFPETKVPTANGLCVDG